MGTVDSLEKRRLKMAKNFHFWTLFDCRKYCPYDSNKNFYYHFTPYQGPMCAMASKLYDWND